MKRRADREPWAEAGRRIDSSTLHVFHDDQLIKISPVTLAGKDLARLRAAGGKPPSLHLLPNERFCAARGFVASGNACRGGA